jgi:Holliday junction resolvase RusA-like endonuclease
MNPEWTLKVERDNKFQGQNLVRVHTKIRLETNIRAMPQPRQNYKSRFTDPKAKRYNEWRKVIRDTLRVEWQSRTKGMIDTDIKVSFEFGAVPAAPPDAKRTKSGEIDGRSIKSVMDYDLNNLIKSTEDIMNGIVYKDDRIIREYGPCKAIDTTEDYIRILIEDCDGSNIYVPKPNDVKPSNLSI